MRRLALWVPITCLLLSACSLIPASSPQTTPAATPYPIVPPLLAATVSAVNPYPFAGEDATAVPPPLTPYPVVIVTAVVNVPSPMIPASVQTLPDPSTAQWTVIASGLDSPVGLADAGDGTSRLFIIEQGGLIRIWQAGELLPEPFLDLSEQVACCGERGLLGLAFHPDYIQNGYFYVNYTLELGGVLTSRIARFQVSGDAQRADPGSERILLEVTQPYENHNGGGLAFGPDGYLYIALGDGGSGGDPQGNGQNLQTHLGKLLRLDVDGGEPYAIPPGNPFAQGGGLPEIWAYGLRNPWRFSFDPLTGDLYIGDVGQNDWEEIDFLPAGSPGGANFGWNVYEGTHPYFEASLAGEPLIFPVAEYGHAQGTSVTGGVVYRGQNLPQWNGVYLYGDFTRGRVWGLLRQPDGAWQNDLLFETGRLISSFGQDASGEVYLVDYSGELLRLDLP